MHLLCIVYDLAPFPLKFFRSPSSSSSSFLLFPLSSFLVLIPISVSVSVFLSFFPLFYPLNVIAHTSFVPSTSTASSSSQIMDVLYGNKKRMLETVRHVARQHFNFSCFTIHCFTFTIRYFMISWFHDFLFSLLATLTPRMWSCIYCNTQYILERS